MQVGIPMVFLGSEILSFELFVRCIEKDVCVGQENGAPDCYATTIAGLLQERWFLIHSSLPQI